MSQSGRLRAILFALFIVAAIDVGSAQAQLDTRLSGYLEHQYSLTRTGDRWRQIDYDRFRADFNVRAGRGSRASVGVIYQLYRGDTRLEASDFLPDGIRFGRDSVLTVLKNQNFLNHAYIVLGSRLIEVTAGKQYLTWGAAWVFNPTELFRPKNAFEPGYDREGVGAISVRLALGPMSELLAGFIPNGRIDNSGRVVRLRHHISGFDVSGLVASTTDDSPRPFSGKLGRRLVVGGDITGELLGLGVWSEATWSRRGDQRWGELTIGGNYSLSDGTLILLEAFFNGRGKSNGPYSAQSWLEKFSGVRRTLGKTTIVGLLSRSMGQLWTIGFATLVNPGDGSAVVIPSISYSFADNVDLLFNGVLNLGGPDDEYGFDQIGGFLRGRIYF
ncbi:MAG: hypothetical protein BMS9Abin05_1204 [Rhodothermia bacterium]|nr:MAG: hypothetical protein BMS9Abin05_1204 [Rhodothermia bacterium]